MKKKILLLIFALSALAVNAQLTLTGTSYTQNFDNIGAGLPVEWSCYKSATSSGLGTLDAYSASAAYGSFYDTTDCAADVFGHGFKNCASADAVSPTATCTAQQAIANRAFGVRQTSGTGTYPGYDPGAAFVLHIANTSGFSGFALSFKLQSLDTRSSRKTTWTVDYGLGAAPTAFTATAPTGYLTTGGGVFSDTTIVVNFGTALDNQSQDVWIRIAALAASTSSGNRTTTAIDDFSLTYTNAVAIASPEQNLFDVKIIPNPNNGKFNLGFNLIKDLSTVRQVLGFKDAELRIYNLLGEKVYSSNYLINQSVKLPIDISSQPAGIYFYEITSDNAKIARGKFAVKK